MKILIPTCRPAQELTEFRRSIEEFARGFEVFISGLPESAAVNRNHCLNQIEVGDIGIMLDDDIEGFYSGWMEHLLIGLFDSEICSARLLNPDGSFGQTCSRCYDAEPEEIEIKSNGICTIPTAAIAFRHRGHHFDESYLGSGWEDNDWCMQYLQADPMAKFAQSNRCKLIHRNEMKSQGGNNWKHNEAYFFNKWHGARRMENVPG